CGSTRADDAYGVKRGDTLVSGPIEVLVTEGYRCAWQHWIRKRYSCRVSHAPGACPMSSC
ncbi:hypothetical protein EIQ23_14810, partial [Xanthomonas campestris pv. campestris]